MNVNFSVFIDKILSGEKRQTIRRASPKWKKVKAGDKLTLYTGLRTKQCRKLGEAVVESITPIEINTRRCPKKPDALFGRICVEGILLKASEAIKLAEADGFDEGAGFLRFFHDHYGEHFVGNIIKWRDFVPQTPPEDWDCVKRQGGAK